MSRYLNFYFSPFENPGARFNFERLHLLESDRCEVPQLKRPPCGGIDERPDYMDGIPACIFETTTTPPTLVKDHFGVTFCAKFGHPQFPKFYCHGRGIFEIDGGKTVMMSDAP